MIIEYTKGEFILTKDKKHVLKVCDTRDEHIQGACNSCFFFKLKGLCTFNREKYLGAKVKGLPCKDSNCTHCVLESSFYYFKEIKGGV
jgi:hypothetical protein